MARAIGLVLAFLAIVATSGCLAAPADATGSGVVYFHGDGRKTYDTDVRHTADAARKVVKDMELDLVSDREDQTGAEIVASTALNRTVTCEVKPLTDKTTELSVRVGMIGDKVITSLIFEKVDKVLIK